MRVILRVTKTFGKGDETWHEARCDELFRIEFRAPAAVKLNVGDAVEFETTAADRETAMPIFTPRGGASVHVRACDIKDLRDRSVRREFNFERITVKLIATGEVELHGPEPQEWSRFDDIDGFIHHFGTESPSRPTSSALEWIRRAVIPALKAAA